MPESARPRLRLLGVMIAWLSSLPAPALAQATELADPTVPHEVGEARPARPIRILGLGTALGVGGGLAASFQPGVPQGSTLGELTLRLPTIEGIFFLDDHVSIDVSIPIALLAIDSINQYVEWRTSLYLDFSVGDDWLRFVVGPGVGLGHLEHGDRPGTGLLARASTEISVGALLGLEILSRGRLFGLRIVTRPTLAIEHFDRRSVVEATRGDIVRFGAMLELVLVWYATNG